MIKPQCAIDILPDFASMRFPVMGFYKVDGVRGCHLTGKFTGRSLEDMKNTAIVAKFSHPFYRGFDGELTIDGLLTCADLPEGETLCSLTTGLTNRSKLRKGEVELPSNVVWNLFDLLTEEMLHLPYLARYEELLREAETLPYIYVLPYRWIADAEEAAAFIEECLEKNYEGAIFRDPKAMHKSGRATVKQNDFWRFKPTSDKDAIVLRLEEAMENQNEAETNALGRTQRSAHKENLVGKGMVGTLVCRDIGTGKTIRVGPGKLTHRDRIHYWFNPEEIVGEAIKYCSLDTGVKNKPRQARFISLRAKSDLEAA